MRPINALVDITNYIAFDRARPLHVYDADKLDRRDPRRGSGGKARASSHSTARPTTVDGDMCVIADDRAVLGLGGVMGGADTGVDRAPPPTCSSSRPISIRSAPRAPDGGSTSSPTRGSGSSAASIPISSCRGSSLRRTSCFELCGGEAGKVEIAGKAPEAQRPLQVRCRPRQALERARSGHWRHQRHARSARHRARRQGQAYRGGAAVLASRHHRSRRPRRGGGAAGRRGQRAGDADDARCRRGAARADRGAEAAAADAPRCSPRAGWSRR